MHYIISKSFEFSAKHQLTHLPAGHKCGRDHGHNYVVTVTLGAEQLDENGFVLDYGELGRFRAWLDNTLDHENLNRVMGGPILTTAESLAESLFYIFLGLYPDVAPGAEAEEGARVRLVSMAVAETPKTLAVYTEPGP